MLINSVSSTYTAPRALSTRSANQASAPNNVTTQGSDNVSISTEGQSTLNSAKDVMSRYNVRNISYNDLQKMGRELYDKGIISGSDELDMTAPPLNLSAIPGQPTPDFDKPQDYVAMYEKMLSFQNVSGATSKDIAWTDHTLSLFRNFSSLQS